MTSRSAAGHDKFAPDESPCPHASHHPERDQCAGHRQRARRLRGGNISIYWFEHGWFWFIPLADGVTSIGAVVWPYYMKSRTVPARDFFLATIAPGPRLGLENGELVSEVEATGNYSYSSERSYGPGFVLVGDAFTFIDPMFSSGVLMAMKNVNIRPDEPKRMIAG